MATRVNIILANPKIKTALRSMFGQSTSLIQKQLKISNFPKVLDFIHRYTSNEYLEAIDVFIMTGTIMVEGLPAYALFFDGDEEGVNKEVIVRVGESEQSEIVAADSPIILISGGVIEDELLFGTTVVHEISHFIDGMPQGEEVAKRLEYNFLMHVYGLSEVEAEAFMVKKYS